MSRRFQISPVSQKVSQLRVGWTMCYNQGLEQKLSSGETCFNMLSRTAPKVFVIVITPDVDSYIVLNVNMLIPVSWKAVETIEGEFTPYMMLYSFLDSLER